MPYAAGFRMNENAQGKDGFDFQLGPDGKIWSYTGAKFVPCNPEKSWHFSYFGAALCMIRIDPETGDIDVVGKLDRAGMIAFSGEDLILSGGCRYLVEKNTVLRKVKGIVPGG